MEDYQVINKIKKLQQIKPRKDWVVFSKNEILGPELKEKTPLFAWFVLPFRKPALVFSSILIIAVALTGVFFYLNSQDSQIVSDDTEVLVSLQGLEARLKEINLSLDDLKNIEDQSQALVMTEIVKSTAEEGVKVMDDLKKSKQPWSKEALASLNGIGTAFKELGETAGDAQIEMIWGLIEYLKQTTLSEENEGRLIRAEQYYKEGEYEQAFIWITLIGNNN